MGSTNYGDQIKTFDYLQEGTSEGFNKLMYHLFPTGILSGGELTKVTNSSVTVSPLICQIEDNDRKVSIRIETQEGVAIAVSASTPFVISRMDWLNVENNWMDIISVAEEDILSGDLIIGRCEYNIGDLVSFDYTRKSVNPIAVVNESKNALKVESNEPQDNKGYVNAGSIYFNNELVTYAGGQSPAISITSTDPRIDLVCISALGVISIVEGTPSSSPVIPAFPEDLLVLAYIEIPSAIDPMIVKGSYITNVVSNSYFRKDSTSTINNLAGTGRTTETVKANADNISTISGNLSNLAGTGRTTETVKANADAIINLAGTGRTTETVKANADALAAIAAYANTYAEATRDSAQAIPTDTETIIIYDDEVSDLGNNYNPATGLYTVPSGNSGLYFIAGMASSADVAWTTNQTWRLSLNIDGAMNIALDYSIAMGSVTVGLRSCGSVIKQLTEGQTVGLSINHPRASTNTRSVAGSNWFIIRRIA
jgi:hypothetical protein